MAPDCENADSGCLLGFSVIAGGAMTAFVPLFSYVQGVHLNVPEADRAADCPEKQADTDRRLPSSPLHPSSHSPPRRLQPIGVNLREYYALKQRKQTQ